MMQSKLLLRDVIDQFIEVRAKTMDLFTPLSVEDAVIQSSNFGSPPNWHIAHVTWFFHKILEKYNGKVDLKNNFNLDYLNSYYQKYGKILTKSERGKYPRPTVTQSIKYREDIETIFIEFLNTLDEIKLSEKFVLDVMTAINHEFQHQELMVYDFQHYFNRFKDDMDCYYPIRRSKSPSKIEYVKREMIEIPGGIYTLGYNGKDFCYDNELPENKVFLNPYSIDNCLVTNGDFMRFMKDGGYENYKFWLADGWDLVVNEDWHCPLYWYFDEEKNKWFKKDFCGRSEINLNEPVVNISYFEADAYAKWANKRLPTEAEWEKAAAWDEDKQVKSVYPWGDQLPSKNHANLFESYIWRPTIAGSFPLGKSHYGCYQMIGDVWEWTSSEYVLYHGFKSRFEEYTDKWAINQKVLRGGCYVTSVKQIRNSYRNYYKPHERIVFAGFRCVTDSHC